MQITGSLDFLFRLVECVRRRKRRVGIGLGLGVRGCVTSVPLLWKSERGGGRGEERGRRMGKTKKKKEGAGDVKAWSNALSPHRPFPAASIALPPSLSFPICRHLQHPPPLPWTAHAWRINTHVRRDTNTHSHAHTHHHVYFPIRRVGECPLVGECVCALAHARACGSCCSLRQAQPHQTR